VDADVNVDADTLLERQWGPIKKFLLDSSYRSPLKGPVHRAHGGRRRHVSAGTGKNESEKVSLAPHHHRVEEDEDESEANEERVQPLIAEHSPDPPDAFSLDTKL